MIHTYVRLPTKILGTRRFGLDLLCSSTLFRNSCRSSPSSSWMGSDSSNSFFACCWSSCCCITRGIFTGRKSSSWSWSSEGDGDEESDDGCCRLVPPNDDSRCSVWVSMSSSSLITIASCADDDAGGGCDCCGGADCMVANVSWINFASSNCCFSSSILSFSFSNSRHAIRGPCWVHHPCQHVSVLLFTQCCA